MGRKKIDKAILKNHGIGTRVSCQEKYIVELLCRIHRLNVSSLLNFLLEKEKKVILSDFHKLWHPDDKVRLNLLRDLRPDLLTVGEK